MHRTKSLHGPYYQDNGVRCIKSLGNFLAPGMPGSGPQALFGVVIDANTIRITFSQCVTISGTTGLEYNIDGGAWAPVTGSAGSDTVWDFTTGVIDPGDIVRWRYAGGSDTIVDCDDSADIGAQEAPVDNPLVLTGDFILLELGGTSVLLLEDASQIPDDAYALETRPI